MPPPRRPSPQSIHNWWSDSNPTGATISLHTLAKPLSKYLYYQQALGVIERSRPWPVSTEIVDDLTCYLDESRAKEIASSTKILILRVLTVEPNGKPKHNHDPGESCTILGNLAVWRSGNAAIVDSNPCELLVALSEHNDHTVKGQAIRQEASSTLVPISAGSEIGAHAVANVGDLGWTIRLARSPVDSVRGSAFQILGSVARHKSTKARLNTLSGDLISLVHAGEALNKVLEEVIKQLESPDHDILIYACSTLGNIVSSVSVWKTATQVAQPKQLIQLLKSVYCIHLDLVHEGLMGTPQPCNSLRQE
ncbi:hypothetical protein C8R44DRAFT_726340 [Mycena epipterygia]|nr:hypothetical protein C8R44DRAFT_726340 [Mycena epipterygia]